MAVLQDREQGGETMKKYKPSDWIIGIVGLALGLILIFPIIYCVLGAFKENAEFVMANASLLPKSFANFSNFKYVLTHTPMMRFMLNSFIVSFIGSAVRLILSVLAAYALVFFDIKHKKLIFFAILATMMIPSDSIIITNFLTVSKMGMLDSYLGIVIVYFVSASQFFMVRQAFVSVPKEYKEAAIIDGCGDFRFLWHVLLPEVKPVLVTVFVQSFFTIWNMYLWPLLVTNSEKMRTVQVGITMLTSIEDSNYSAILAGVTVVLIPSFIIFALMRRKITDNVANGTIIG